MPYLALLPAIASLVAPASASYAPAAFLLRARGGGVDLEELVRSAQDPEALEELKRMMADPEALAEYQELMNDPEFRRQMMEAMAKGGDKVQQITNAISDNADLSEALEDLGPSISACLDLIQQVTTTAEDYGGAIGALEGLAQRLATKGATEPKYRRVRLSNPALNQRLLQFAGGKTALMALGFQTSVEVEGEEYLEHSGEGLPEDGVALAPSSALGRLMQALETAREEVAAADRVAQEHSLPYRLTIMLPKVRGACAGDAELGQLLTQMMLQNEEFRSHVNGPASEMALPSILQMLRSREGIEACVDFYTGSGAADSLVTRVTTVSEWKQALDDAGDRPVCALFTNSIDIGCRVLAPAFHKLPDADEERFRFLSNAELIHVLLDKSKDDGLAQQVFDEAYVALGAVPSFLFFRECLELRKWRYQGADIGEVVRRLRRIEANDNLEDGPDAELE